MQITFLKILIPIKWEPVEMARPIRDPLKIFWCQRLVSICAHQIFIFSSSNIKIDSLSRSSRLKRDGIDCSSIIHCINKRRRQRQPQWPCRILHQKLRRSQQWRHHSSDPLFCKSSSSPSSISHLLVLRCCCGFVSLCFLPLDLLNRISWPNAQIQYLSVNLHLNQF